MNIYLEAFGIFFKIGAFTIGGGYAMVPLIENEIVTKRKWIAQEDFIDLLAISQSAPGILAVNISIFIGYKLRGIRGSIITALGTILPYRCGLVASPSKTPKMGDIAVWPQGDNTVKLVSVVQNKMGKFFASTQEPQELKELSASDMEKMHKVVLIAMP